ncbi:hypothetical protein ALC62_06163 [Cyphomyrmex costatus]|uniref:Uncharacterized protein n=1 Tax=Cyphomyrmex costatus TaxID=456900 RepID=A0A195CQP6_9HYME|nr:hypothetical protein ALC62_06163 [Cyphomyrmex costatus]
MSVETVHREGWKGIKRESGKGWHTVEEEKAEMRPQLRRYHRAAAHLGERGLSASVKGSTERGVGAECWLQHARVDPGVARGWLRTGFSSVIIAEQQQSDDPATLVYGTLRVGFGSVCELSRRHGGILAFEKNAHLIPM